VIDRGLSEEWPEEVVAATRLFKQGDVIEMAPLFDSADTTHPIWVLTRRLAEEGDIGVQLIDIDPAHGLFAHVIITTQTCDIGEQSQTPEMPWIQVAPVYGIQTGDQLLTRGYVIRLTGPTFIPGLFVADLRLEMPLEKSLLVGLRPTDGFTSENDYVAFAELLGRRRQRAAIASSVYDLVRGGLRRKANGNQSRWARVGPQVYKLKLSIQEGTRADPRAVQLHVVSVEPLNEDARGWFEQWWDRERLEAERRGFALLANGYIDKTNIDVRIYDQLIELDITW